MDRRRCEGGVILCPERDERHHFRRVAERWSGPVSVLLIHGLRGLHALRCIIVGQR